VSTEVSAAGFLVADATNLALLGDGNFDSVVMAFNGMDALVPGEARLRCLAENPSRVEKRQGVDFLVP
jgi:hypothetical protein